MRARLLLLATLVISVLLFAPALASAATPPTSVSLQMQGGARVDRSQQVPRLQLSADATDRSGYHLDATLWPTASVGSQSRQGRRGGGEGDERGERESRSGLTNLGGQFTLSGQGMPTVSGNVSGQIGNNGVGTINLSTSDGATQLNGNLLLDNAGNVEVEVAGQLSAAGQAPASGQSEAAAGPQVNHVFWYLARAAGLSAYLMLFLNVVLGLAVNTRFMDAVVARWRSFDLHEFTGLLAMGLLAIHGLALVGDRYIGFTLPQVLLPLNLPYRPLWTALGIIGMYVLVVVTASSYVRKQLGYRAWRVIHFLSFAAYVLALVHGVMAGTDTGEPWARALYLSTGAFVAVLTVWRFGRARRREPARPAQRSASKAA